MSVNRRALTRGFSAIQTQLSVEAHVCEQQVRILYLSFSEHVHAYVRGELLSGSLSSPCRFIQARLTRSMRAMTGAGATICSDDSLLASSGADLAKSTPRPDTGNSPLRTRSRRVAPLRHRRLYKMDVTSPCPSTPWTNWSLCTDCVVDETAAEAQRPRHDTRTSLT